jgi:ferrochelatase
VGDRAPRLAVVLFNLGGPDGPDAVRPFLFNLFSDPAIISAPGPVRLPLAGLIAAARAKPARANYALMGGGSPLLPETLAQAAALGRAFAAAAPGFEARVFIAMRYWGPSAAEAANAVAAFRPDEVVLLPLYPQYSTTTTGSSLAQWKSLYRGGGRVRTVCCYPTARGFVAAHALKIRAAWEAAGRPGGVRLLFSAHGLPEQVIARGDPYQSQVEATAAAIAEQLGPDWSDWRVCYQSRVGPMKWLGPTTLDMIQAAADDGLGVVIAPIAFVSEHVETLVELDHDYARKAAAMDCPVYVRVPALGVDTAFIHDLARLVSQALAGPEGIWPGSDFVCAANWGKCPRGSGEASA